MPLSLSDNLLHQSTIDRIARILEYRMQYPFHRSQASGLFQRNGIGKVQHTCAAIQSDMMRPGLQTADRINQSSVFDDQDGVG